MLGLGLPALAAWQALKGWSPHALWPTGTEPGMWIDPSNLASQWQDSTGTTPVSTPGTVADSSNPVGLALDLRLGATALTDPGNHLLQATSTARPLLSARVNLLTYTEDFIYGAVAAGLSSITGGSVLGPFGSVDGTKLTENASTGIHYVRSNFPTNIVAGATYVRSCFFKKGSGERYVQFGMTYGSDTFGAVVDLDSGAVTVGTTGVGTVTSASVTTVGGWFFCSVSGTMGPSITTCYPYEQLSKDSTYGNAVYTGDGTSFIYCFGRDFRKYSDSTVVYQSVPGDGSTYSSTGFPIYQYFDGTDDGMATATFAAGTLSNNMDCLIAVRRDSAAWAPLGLAGDQDGIRFFGFVSDGDYTANYNCGTPTVWVDGIQVAGGTNVRQNVLNAAVSVGDFHILEFRGLDLSGWTRLFTGLGVPSPAFILNGAQGGILLFPSSTSTADRDAARTWLGAKVGLTLP